MRIIVLAILGLVGVVLAAAPGGTTEPITMYPELTAYVEARVAEFDEIGPERRAQLEALAQVVSGEVSQGRPVRLTFVCTHNSRRSHLAQAWATVGAAYDAIPGVETYSGGVEVTAFNPRAVEALRRAGLGVEHTDDPASGETNPIYLVRIGEDAAPQTHFSKVYDQAPNPSEEFIAVMVCSHADDTCPHVPGARARLAITYEDPKAFDGTPLEAEKYDDRCRQIAREMLYALSRVNR